jgi:hypothetical protein
LAEACPLCRHRKPKRHCPAKGALICSVCCGEKRRVEIDCPEDCVYLHGSHAPSWDGRETERRRDLRRLAPYVGALGDEEAQLFFATLVGIDRIRLHRKDLTDATLAAAVSALSSTLKTRSQGVIYDHPAEGLEAQGVAGDLLAFWKRFSEKEPLETPGLGKVLEVLVQALSAPGDGEAFVETASRLVRRHGLTLKEKEKEKPSSILVP